MGNLNKTSKALQLNSHLERFFLLLLGSVLRDLTVGEEKEDV